jgi:hypothetical protein
MAFRRSSYRASRVSRTCGVCFRSDLPAGETSCSAANPALPRSSETRAGIRWDFGVRVVDGSAASAGGARTVRKRHPEDGRSDGSAASGMPAQLPVQGATASAKATPPQTGGRSFLPTRSFLMMCDHVSRDPPSETVEPQEPGHSSAAQCPASALMGQFWVIERRRVSGSS